MSASAWPTPGSTDLVDALAVDLLVADAVDLALNFALAPQWGVYLNGSPVIQPASLSLLTGAVPLLATAQAIASTLGSPISQATASTVEFEYAQEWPISTYPQEQGAFQSYDKVTLPFDVKLKMASGGDTTDRQLFLDTCLAIADSFALFDVVTPEMVLISVSASHIGWRRTATEGATLIAVDLWFQQISVTSTATFTSTQTPVNAGQQSIGNVQPQTPSQYVAQEFSAMGVQ